MAIDKELFLEKLIEFLKANNNNMSLLNSRRFGRGSDWAKITTSIYGSYDGLKTLELHSAWKNNRNIREKLNVLIGKSFKNNIIIAFAFIVIYFLTRIKYNCKSKFKF